MKLRGVNVSDGSPPTKRTGTPCHTRNGTTASLLDGAINLVSN